METHAKKLEHLCALLGRINTCQHFPMDRWPQPPGKKKVATFSAGLFACLLPLKNGNRHVFCELILGKTVPALAQGQLDFLALVYTEFYVNLFYLNLIISKFYLYFLQCLSDQAKQIDCH